MTTGQDIVARIAIVRTQDHVRGCDGRHYSCDCGYERDLDGVLSEAAALIETQAAEMERLRGAHTEVIKTVAYYGMMGRLHGLEHLREGLNKIGEIACRAEQPATAIASGAYRGEAG